MDTKLLLKLQNEILNVTQKLKLDLLGPKYLNKAFKFMLKDFDPKTTIGHVYMDAMTNHAFDPKASNDSILGALEQQLFQTIEGTEQKANSDITRSVTNLLKEMEIGSKLKGLDPQEYLKTDDFMSKYKEFEDSITKTVQFVNTSAKTIANNELNTVQNFGAHAGIMHTSAAMGISDPIVFKIGSADGSTRCAACWKLWYMDDRITPRLYKMSELDATPGNDRKNPRPSISVTHINCACMLATLSPGMGFEAGKVNYVGPDHDEYAKQQD